MLHAMQMLHGAPHSDDFDHAFPTAQAVVTSARFCSQCLAATWPPMHPDSAADLQAQAADSGKCKRADVQVGERNTGVPNGDGRQGSRATTARKLKKGLGSAAGAHLRGSRAELRRLRLLAISAFRMAAAAAPVLLRKRSARRSRTRRFARQVAAIGRGLAAAARAGTASQGVAAPLGAAAAGEGIAAALRATATTAAGVGTIAATTVAPVAGATRGDAAQAARRPRA